MGIDRAVTSAIMRPSRVTRLRTCTDRFAGVQPAMRRSPARLQLRQSFLDPKRAAADATQSAMAEKQYLRADSDMRLPRGSVPCREVSRQSANSSFCCAIFINAGTITDNNG